MARTVIHEKFNGGLELTQNRSLIGPTKCHKAQNVVFTRSSVRRRLGKRVAAVRVFAGAVAINLLKRFYDLATTGTISKYFLASVDLGSGAGALYKAATAWADAADYGVGGKITSWTSIAMPNTGGNTLYSDYSSTQAVCAMTQGVASKSWCYFAPVPTSGDDTAKKTTQVGVRTNGTAAYLMGLVPPATLDVNDVSLFNDIPPSDQWVGSAIDAAVPTESGPGCLRLGSDGRVHAAYIRGGTPYYNVRSVGGTWGTPSQVSAVAMGITYGAISMDVDSVGIAHIAFYDAVNFQIYYATNASGSFVAEIADTTGLVGLYNSIGVDQSGLPHIVYSDEGVFRLVHKSRSPSGTWSAVTVIKNVAGNSFRPAIQFGSDGRLHAVFSESTANSNIWYAVRSAAGAWGAAVQIGPAADNTDYPCAIALDSSGNPGILYNNVTDTALEYMKYNGTTWSSEEVVDGALQDSCSLSFDPDNTPHILYENNNLARYNNRQGGTWGISGSVAALNTPGSVLGIQLGPDYTIHAGTTTTTDVSYSTVTRYLYHYRLTAEYDTGILGESAPSGFVSVGYNQAVTGGFAHTLALANPTIANRYDMTPDVTIIYVYRTTNGAGSAGTYYRVGSVPCTAGSPSVDLVDNVSDLDLVLTSNTILDSDKFMPPKFLHVEMWKDRMVIGNLKCRDLGATEGDLNSLDLADSGIHKNRIRFSDAFHPDIYREGFFQDIIPDGDSGSITALVVNPKIDALFVFMENDVVALLDPAGDLVSTLSFRPKNVANSKGTPSPRSVVEHDGILLYWTKTGIEAISGFEGRNITSKSIGNLWNMLDSTDPAYADRINMSKLNLVVGKVVHREERIYWSYPAGTSTYNNRVLCFDYGLWRDKGFGEGVFSIFTGWDISSFETWDGEGDREELFGAEADALDGPWTYRLNYGQFDENGDPFAVGTTDTDVPITSAFYPGVSPYGSEKYKAFKSASVELVTGVTTVTVKLDVDNEKTLDTLAAVSWPDGSKVQRKNFGLPRTANGVRAGLRFDVVDPAGGPAPWELVDVAMRLDDLPTRMRP